MEPVFTEFEKILGITFQNKDLLYEALSHSSYANEKKKVRRSNERLEFLGDSVLSIVVSQYLFENYPDLEAHDQIADAMQQNMYLQREITAARELYNDTVNAWNRDVFAWPTKMIVAARNGYTTRIPFIASAEIKAKAKDVFF